MLTALTNCQIFTGKEILTNHSLILANGQIVDIVKDDELAPHITTCDLNNNLLAPGYIDTQVNGGAGLLFNDAPTKETIQAIGNIHRRYGTTGFLPTLISDDHNIMDQAINAVTQCIESNSLGVIGIHLEGPYLNKDRKGVHREEKIRMPDENALKQLLKIANLGTSMVTLAPEVTPNGFIKRLVKAKVKVSIGHSEADYSCTQEALGEGATGFTHLFNAMSPLTSRSPGVTGAALEDPNSWCGIIVDGHHVHPCTLKIAIAAKPKGKMMLVTDAVHTVGATGETFDLMGKLITRTNGKVCTEEGTLAGSDLDMATAVKNTVKLLGFDKMEALRMASLYPACFLSLDDKLGMISKGYTANLVLLDNHLDVLDTWINGVSTKAW